MRAALSGAAISFGMAPSRARQNLSQSDAEYQDTPKSGLTCAACSLFRPPRSGEIVEGDISPDGWCRFFDLPRVVASSHYSRSSSPGLTR